MSKQSGLPRRVYPKHGAYWFVDRKHKWHRLCAIAEGEKMLYERLSAKLEELEEKRVGNVQALIEDYKKEYLPSLAASTAQQYRAQYDAIAKGFREFNYGEVTPKIIKTFLKQFSATPRTQSSTRGRDRKTKKA
jgi:hypothetical protein